MRKQIISQDPQNILPADQSWLDLQHVARVELTSEDAVPRLEKWVKEWKTDALSRENL
jgi:hypothetical protein